jgi:hypothetical protein
MATGTKRTLVPTGLLARGSIRLTDPVVDWRREAAIYREGTQPLRADVMLALGTLAAFLGIPALWFWFGGF